MAGGDVWVGKDRIKKDNVSTCRKTRTFAKKPTDFSGKIDSSSATFLPAPLTDSEGGVINSLCVERASPWLLPDTQKSFTRNSARHSLPCSDAARLAPFEYQVGRIGNNFAPVEIGCWSGALAYRRELLATSTLTLKHTI